MERHSPFIITGGPGSGKTTLLDALAARDCKTFEEVPRKLIEEQSKLENGILPWNQLAAFAELCFKDMMNQRQAASTSDQLSFLDRAIPDICAYLTFGNEPVPPRVTEQAKLGYQPLAFTCEPNTATYVQDDVRPYPFEEALEIHRQLIEQYQSLGYRCISVPFLKLEQRVEFVLAESYAHLGQTA
ncbi:MULTISPECIES: AAA family ATPase [Vibrio]|uniref:AAA family ATPase n=1 Tax=Vibrio TaxID=662 RepID=UPI0004DCEE18|nr:MULTISPECIES: AAA family ATPase [Vibrio]KFB00086.1 ATPase [Vibrio sp. ER1A]NOH29367.1 AAA family ATPase [Vibrio mediterranei]